MKWSDGDKWTLNQVQSDVEESRLIYETIQFSAANGIARITLNRPDRLNSFTRAMHAELREALDDLGDARSSPGDAAEAESSRDQCDHEKG